MPNPNIGHIACPACDFEDADVRETIKGKVYIVCDECGYQAFTRGDLSNTRIRAKMRPVDPAPIAAPAVPPAPKPKVPRAKEKAAPAAKPTEPAKTDEGFGTWLGI